MSKRAQKSLCPAHISQNSDSERPTNVVSHSRKHSIHILTAPKTEIAKSACEPR